MKKKFLFPLLFPLLIGCFSRNNANSSNGGENSAIIIPTSSKKGSLLFTELHTGSLNVYDRAIEVSNYTDEDIELTGYTINIYKQSEKTVYQKIELNGKLKSKMAYVIVDSKASEPLLNKSNLIVDNLMIDGSWPLSLSNNGSEYDFLGIIGYQYAYAKKCSYARKEGSMEPRDKFDEYDWIAYDTENISLLGEMYPPLSDVELLEGPKLTKENFDTPLTENEGAGSGGAAKVNLRYLGDGDTTNFTLPSDKVDTYLNTYETVRYIFINTPEISHGDPNTAEPWGEAAKKYNNTVLKNAKSYAIQTIKNHGLRDTYGRLLGLVWYSNKNNPQPEDYVCLNFEMVREAYAFYYFAEDNHSMFYKGLSYVNFIKNAEAYAKRLGLRIHGEVDPDFDY